MPDARALEAVRNFGTALLIGALVGIERDKRKEQEAEPSIGGLRTFILMSLLGAIGGWLADALHARRARGGNRGHVVAWEWRRRSGARWLTPCSAARLAAAIVFAGMRILPMGASQFSDMVRHHGRFRARS